MSRAVMINARWYRPLVFTLCFALLAVLVARVAQGSFTWGVPEIPKAQCEALDPAALTMHEAAYRTEITAAVVREPQNTWSNLAFVLAGALIWTRHRRFLPRLLAGATISLGLASGLYHASLMREWRTLDVITMGWTAAALGLVGFEALVLGRNRAPRLRRSLPWLGILACVCATAVAVFRNEVRVAGIKPFDTTYTTIAGIGVVFTLLVLAIIRSRSLLPEARVPLSHIAGLAGSVIIAAFLQLNDRPGHCCCAPESSVQGHAVWHVLMALAVYLAFDLFDRASHHATSRTVV